jgi:preprotein translocase subunit SecG
MATLLLVIHILVCFFLIFIVLIQSGKGAELGAAFGGSGQTLFGARGAATIFSKLTTISAIVFMITSLSLAVITSRGASVVKQVPITEQRRAIPPAPGAGIPGAGPVQGQPPAQPVVPNAPAAPAVPAAPSK